MSLPQRVQRILDEARVTATGEYHIGTSVPVMDCPVLKTATELKILGYKFKHKQTNCFGDRVYHCEELNAIYIIDHD